jgi:hypothetical protein
LLNTTVDLAGEDVAEVAAYLDNQGRAVETLGVVIARLKSGVLSIAPRLWRSHAIVPLRHPRLW